jgi:hypothetical protein
MKTIAILITCIFLSVINYKLLYYFYFNLLLLLPIFHNLGVVFVLLFTMLFAMLNYIFLEYFFQIFEKSFKIFEKSNIIVSFSLACILISIMVTLSFAKSDATKIEIDEYGVKKFVTITQKTKKIDHAIDYYYFSAKTFFEGDSLEFDFGVYSKQYKKFNIGDSIQIVFSKRIPSICRLK